MRRWSTAAARRAAGALPLGFQLVAVAHGTMRVPTASVSRSMRSKSRRSVLARGPCGCDLKQAPSCTVGGGATITLGYGRSGRHLRDGRPGRSDRLFDRGIHGPVLPYERNYTAPLATLTGGACDVKVVTDDTKLSTKSLRVPGDGALVRRKDVPARSPGFTACIAATGDVACRRLADEAPRRFDAKLHVQRRMLVHGRQPVLDHGHAQVLPDRRHCTGGADLTYPSAAAGRPAPARPSMARTRYDPAGPSSTRCNTNGISTPARRRSPSRRRCAVADVLISSPPSSVRRRRSARRSAPANKETCAKRGLATFAGAGRSLRRGRPGFGFFFFGGAADADADGAAEADADTLAGAADAEADATSFAPASPSVTPRSAASTFLSSSRRCRCPSRSRSCRREHAGENRPSR